MGLEQQIAATLGQEHLMVTARGTSALWLALTVLNPERRGVLVPANVCEVVIAAIHYAGLEPIYVDVDPIVGNLDIPRLDLCSSPTAGVLIAVHNFGSPLPMQAICDWARARDIFVIEDACNALGVITQGRPVGTWGDAALYSFGMAKIVNVGSGGVLAARDPSFLQECRRLETTLEEWDQSLKSRDTAFQSCLRTLRQYPELKEPAIYRALYQSYRPALVARAASGTADIIAEGLGNLPTNLDIRRRRAEHYREQLAHPAITHCPVQVGEVCWRYICHLPAHLRDGAVSFLRSQSLPISTWYPAVDRLFGERPEQYEMPGADSFEQTVTNLWVEPGASDDVVQRTAECLLEYLSSLPTE